MPNPTPSPSLNLSGKWSGVCSLEDGFFADVMPKKILKAWRMKGDQNIHVMKKETFFRLNLRQCVDPGTL